MLQVETLETGVWSAGVGWAATVGVELGPG